MKRPAILTNAMVRLERVGRKIWDEAPPVGTPRGYLKGYRLSDLLPYRYWDETKEIYAGEKSVGIMLEVIPLLGADEGMGRILAELFNDGLPAGAKLQVTTWASPKIGAVTDGWADARGVGGPIYQELARHRREHFRKAAWEGASKHAPFYMRDFHCYVSVEVAGTLESAIVDDLVEARERLIAGFRTIQSAAATLRPERLISLMRDILNPSTSIRSAAEEYDSSLSLCEQMLSADTTYTVFRDKLVVQTHSESDGYQAEAWEREKDGRDERFEMRGFSVRQFPSTWTQGGMTRVLGDIFNDQIRLHGPTLMTLVCVPMTYEKTRSQTDFKRMRTDQAANGPTGKFFPQLRKAADDWAMVAEDVAEGARLAHMGLFITTMSPEGNGERAERALRAVYRNCGFSLQRDDDVHLQTLLTCLPMSLGSGMDLDLTQFGRLRRMPTTVAARLAPLQGEFLGATTPHMLLAGRRGQVFYFSNFGNTEGNHNVAVVGSSGSGKSVMMQEMASGLRGSGAEVVVIDDGRSFMNSCRLQGGAFIRFSMDLNVCMNPFSMADHELAAEDPEYLLEIKKSIMLMVEVMARGQTRASAEEAGVIETAVSRVWERHGPEGSIDAVAEAMRSEEFGERGANLALSLAPYTAQGSYGGFFNGQANLDISNPYTVFEMGDLETKKDLRAVIILGILNLIRQRMKKGGRALKKALIIDEAWQLLGDGATGEFIEGFARRCRKEGGALITGTQSLNDFYKTSGARACIENSDWQVFLRLKTEALDQLRTDQRLGVDETTMQLLKSLRTSDGEYSEMLIQGPQAKFLGRLVLDRFSATLYSTRPEVYAAVEQMTAAGMSLVEAVRAVAFKAAPAAREAA